MHSTPCSTLFPYTTLFRSIKLVQKIPETQLPPKKRLHRLRKKQSHLPQGEQCQIDSANQHPTDRKSTRLNSSHLVNSYAVFCLKKKKKKNTKNAKSNYRMS